MLGYHSCLLNTAKAMDTIAYRRITYQRHSYFVFKLILFSTALFQYQVTCSHPQKTTVIQDCWWFSTILSWDAWGVAPVIHLHVDRPHAKSQLNLHGKTFPPSVFGEAGIISPDVWAHKTVQSTFHDTCVHSMLKQHTNKSSCNRLTPERGKSPSTAYLTFTVSSF